MKRKENFPKPKKCRECQKEFTPYNSLQKYCSYQCAKSDSDSLRKKPRKPIKVISKQRAKDLPKYIKLREEFLSKPENQVCFIDGCFRFANSIEHSAGRRGYADDWAKENKISLYLDVRFWKPCCWEHNLELERNSELSKKYQLSKITGKPKN